jgi:hypothetical protein
MSGLRVRRGVELKRTSAVERSGYVAAKRQLNWPPSPCKSTAEGTAASMTARMWSYVSRVSLGDRSGMPSCLSNEGAADKGQTARTHRTTPLDVMKAGDIHEVRRPSPSTCRRCSSPPRA